MNDKFFDILKDKIQPYFEEGGGHAFDHTQRVYNLAINLSKGEKVDLDIVKASVLLHDIARKEQDDTHNQICHADRGAEIAEEILIELNFPRQKIKEVLHSIKVHRHSKGLKAETKEAEILQDADRLDALGAITIGRMFSTCGKINRPMHNPNIPIKEVKGYSETTINGFYNKILKIKPETFNTKKAKQIAKDRYKFVEEFLERFLEEWNGNL